jgi:hypothetical protein
MSAKGKVQMLLGLIDLEGDFPHAGQRWLKGDQPTIAARLGCSPRTLRTIIKDPAFVTLRTRLGGKNVTLIRRADPKAAVTKAKSAIEQVPKAKSAIPKSKSANIDATFEQFATREELRLIWVRHQFMPDDARVTPKEYGLLLELAKLGITPAVFRYVIENWKEFLNGVNTLCTDPTTDKSLLKAYRPEPWLGTIVQFPEAAKEVYITHKQAEMTLLDKLADEL